MRHVEQRVLLPNAVLAQEGKDITRVGQAVGLCSRGSSGWCCSSQAVVVLFKPGSGGAVQHSGRCTL